MTTLLSVAQRSAVRKNLALPVSVSLSGVNFLELFRLLLLHPDATDPTGQTHSKPLRGSRRGVMAVLGGLGKLIEEPWSETHLAFDATVAVFRADYIRHRQADRLVLKTLRRYTGAKMLSLFGRMDDVRAQAILPDPYKGDGWQTPKTIITDGFAGGLGAWTMVDGTYTGSSGVLNMTVNASVFPGALRHDTALSSDEHYAEIVQVTRPAFNRRFFGPATRFQSDAETFYLGQVREDNNQRAIFKVIASSETVLATDTTASSWPQTIRLISDGADLHTLKVDTVEVTSVTDTSITGNLQAGIASHSSWSDHGDGDDFEAADLAAPGARPQGPLGHPFHGPFAGPVN